MDREFADSDEVIIQNAGKSIPAIFADDGESVFRKLETKTLQTLCKRNGLVIATGGGIVTKPENRDIIRQNGIIVFLDRDLSLLPVSGRPLSEKEGVGALAAIRLPIYKQWCDFTVIVNGVEQTAEYIHKMIISSCANH